MLDDKRILLIISGGIAAYKSLVLIRRLRERGADVRCVLTAGGAQFVTPLSVAALSEDKVYSELSSDHPIDLTRYQWIITTKCLVRSRARAGAASSGVIHPVGTG